MRGRYPLWSIVAVVIVFGWIVAGRAQNPPRQAPNSDAAYVQVSSVSVEPSAIHKLERPDATTMVVQIIVRGRVPPDSTAKVSVGTFSTDPPGSNVIYDPSRTASLKESPAAVKLEARAGAQTKAGKLIVAASINGVTNVGLSTGVRFPLLAGPGSYCGAMYVQMY